MDCDIGPRITPINPFRKLFHADLLWFKQGAVTAIHMGKIAVNHVGSKLLVVRIGKLVVHNPSQDPITFCKKTKFIQLIQPKNRWLFNKDMFAGKNTGAVYQWTPGQDAFVVLPGAETPGNNGIDTVMPSLAGLEWRRPRSRSVAQTAPDSDVFSSSAATV